MKKVEKNNCRILKEAHAYFHLIVKALVKLQKDQPKTVGGVAETRYLLQIRNHAPRITHHGKPKTMSSAFETASDNKKKADVSFKIIYY